jgi:hypothetical protein
MHRNANRPHAHRQDHTSADVSLALASAPPPLLPPGIYAAVFSRAKRVEAYKRQQLVLQFQILGAEGYPVADLQMFCNLRANGSVAPRGKFARTWELAAGRRLTRHDRMTTNIFRERVFDVSVRTVERDQAQQPLTGERVYSVVDRVVGLAAGGGLR